MEQELQYRRPSGGKYQLIDRREEQGKKENDIHHFQRGNPFALDAGNDHAAGVECERRSRIIDAGVRNDPADHRKVFQRNGTPCSEITVIGYHGKDRFASEYGRFARF